MTAGVLAVLAFLAGLTGVMMVQAERPSTAHLVALAIVVAGLVTVGVAG